MLSINEQSQVKAWLEAERNGERFPVDFNIAWVMAGYAQKGHAKRRLTNQTSYLNKDEDYKIDEVGVPISQSGKSGLSGRSSDRIVMTCDAFKHFCLMAQTAKGRNVRQYFIEAEKTLTKIIPHCQVLNDELEQLRQQVTIKQDSPDGQFRLHCDKLSDTYRYTIAVNVGINQYIELMSYTLPSWIAQEKDFDKFQLFHQSALMPISEMVKMLNRMSQQFEPVSKPALTQYAK